MAPKILRRTNLDDNRINHYTTDHAGLLIGLGAVEGVVIDAQETAEEKFGRQTHEALQIMLVLVPLWCAERPCWWDAGEARLGGCQTRRRKWKGPDPVLFCTPFFSLARDKVSCEKPSNAFGSSAKGDSHCAHTWTKFSSTIQWQNRIRRIITRIITRIIIMIRATT